MNQMSAAQNWCVLLREPLNLVTLQAVELNFGVFGDVGVGKSSLIRRFVLGLGFAFMGSLCKYSTEEFCFEYTPTVRIFIWLYILRR